MPRAALVILALAGTLASPGPALGDDCPDDRYIVNVPLNSTTVFVPPVTNDGNGSAGGGASWTYDLTSDRGLLHTRFGVGSGCCSVLYSADATCRFDDLVFSSPGGTGGTAVVSFNLDIVGTSTHSGDCASAPHDAWADVLYRVNSHSANSLGHWSPASNCGSDPSTGVFTGISSDSLSGTFTSAGITVPLDVPMRFDLVCKVSASGDDGGQSLIDMTVSLPTTGPVFNLPAGISANSTCGHISENGWFGVAPLGDVTGDRLVDVADLLEVLAGWGPCPEPCPPSCARDTNDDCMIDVTDLLQVLADWS